MDERLQQFETKMEKTCEYLEADFMTTVLPRRCSRWAM